MATSPTISAAGWRTIQICALYAVTSISISLCYKALLSSWEFDSKYIMLLGQVGVGLIFTTVAQQTMQKVPGMYVPDFDWNTYIESIPVGVLFVVNIAIGWYGMQLIDVPMFLCLRRTTTILTMVGEFFLLGTKQSGMVVLSVLIIMAGTIVAGYDELGDDFMGYMYTLMNNVLTALYLNVSRRFSDRTQTKGFGLVYYNSITAVPLALLGSIVLGDFEKAANFEHIWNPLFWGAFVLASTLGTFMTYVVFLSATVNSPLLTSITGNLKDVVATVIGAIAFGDFVPTPLKVTGLAVSLLGGGTFAAVKLHERNQKAQQPKDPQAPGAGAAAATTGAGRGDGEGTGTELALKPAAVTLQKGAVAARASPQDDDVESGLLDEQQQQQQQKQLRQGGDVGRA